MHTHTHIDTCIWNFNIFKMNHTLFQYTRQVYPGVNSNKNRASIL